MEADYDSPDNDPQLETLQQAYLSMQKKLRDQDVEYEARVNEQVKKNILNQQQMEDLNRDLKTMRREILELKTTERFKTSQIADLEKQMEKTERTNSTQKSTAAALKRQKDELEDENERMQDILRQKEDALNQATLRLTAIEAEARRINADQETMETLRERLMAEITKNEEMATQLELVSSKLRQTEELTGGQRSEFDVTTNGQINASLDDVALQGRNLMSELANVGAKFGPGYDQTDESVDISKRPASDATAKWDPAHEGTRRLLRESTSFGMKMKRSSLRDLSQRFGASLSIYPDGPYSQLGRGSRCISSGGQNQRRGRGLRVACGASGARRQRDIAGPGAGNSGRFDRRPVQVQRAESSS
ncbi:hypothetical protein K457DRAFT_215254 [Linnemannia elongata AG-77]|uniref:NUDE domain-containing protein n=1 Tax=Linnemannia elongata AG-77 TaxID=1314771 RepID=A0A197K6Q3_9FUNG|nr:hypothetical protein K457DRAFT_215254 [Linnemannia elongata AG-77]